ncbi:hypothetical protein AAC387_Pa05g2896 [Persea americana]
MEDAYQQYRPAWGYPPGQPRYPHGSTATVHPYPVPQPETNNPAPPPPPDPIHPPRASSHIGDVLAAILGVVILGGFIGSFCLIGIFTNYEFPSFSISSISVSRFNLSSTNLTADWDIVFSVRNPNKHHNVEYGTFDANVYYGSALLAKTTLSPFSQGKHEEIPVTISVAALSSYVNEDAALRLAADHARGSIEFRVRLLFSAVSIRSHSRGDSGPLLIKVWCVHVPVDFSSPQGSGLLSGAPRKCKVS